MIYRGYAIFRKHQGRIVTFPKEDFPKDNQGIRVMGALSSIGPKKL